VVPSLQLVLAITSAAYNQPHGQPRSEQILLRTLAAFTNPEPGGR
jgi:hypothetical protein